MTQPRFDFAFRVFTLMVLLAFPLSTAAQGVLYVEGDNVGIGVPTPEQELHVQGEGAQVLVRETSPTTGQRFLFTLENEHGGVSFRMNNLEVSHVWEFFGSNAFFINNITNPGIEFQINPDGTVIINGNVTHTPDYVFEPDYKPMPLPDLARFVEENKHLPDVPSATEVEGQGINLQEFQMTLLRKIEELTLYVIDQDKRVESQEDKIEALRQENAELKARLEG